MKRFLVLFSIFALVSIALFVPNNSAEVIELIPEWYGTTNLDTNKNGLDDSFDQLLEPEPSGKIANLIEAGYVEKDNLPVFIDLSHRPAEQDIKNIQALGSNIQIDHISKQLNVILATGLTLDQVVLVSLLPGVFLVEFQGVYGPVMETSARAVKSRPSTEYSPYTAQEYNGGYTGAGITVAVLDTGVDDEHDGLDGKFIAGVDFMESSDNQDGTYNPDDKDGHGTHCAGTIMGRGTQGRNIGVAPGANLVDLKVLNDWGFGGNLYEGIEWSIQNQDTFGIDVLSISIGELMGGNSDGSDSNGRIAQQAVENGMVVVAAIGNDGNDHVGISSPAAADNVIAVGAIDDYETVDRTNDHVADFSQSGPRKDDGDLDPYDEAKPDVVAPGVDITSCASYNGNLGILGAAGYTDKSGTSMACPHVAGVCALIKEANPDISAVEVQDIIRSSAEPKGVQYDETLGNYSVLYGWGMLDAYEAVKMSTGDFQKVTISTPSVNQLTFGELQITGTATNQKGYITRVELSIDGGGWVTAEGTYSWSYTLDTTGLENGDHTLEVRSENDQYEYSDLFVQNFKVNNIKITIDTPSGGSKIESEIEIKGSCDGTNIENVQIRVGNGQWVGALNTAMSSDWTSWKFIWDSKSSGDGAVKIEVKAISGEQTVTDTVTVQVDNEDPSEDQAPGYGTGLVIIAIVFFIVINTMFIRGKRQR